MKYGCCFDGFGTTGGPCGAASTHFFSGIPGPWKSPHTSCCDEHWGRFGRSGFYSEISYEEWIVLRVLEE